MRLFHFYLQLALKHNFPSAVASVACFTYLHAYPFEMRLHNSVPALLLHSVGCGTGKSTALEVATRLHGQNGGVSFIMLYFLFLQMN